jgi:NAD(P)-dependent dehydrogenase (short-subunit alcohol dehydrogenase family)
MTAWTVDQISDQTGRRVVAGSSSGLGEVTAHELVRKGSPVVLAVRSPGKGEAATTRIRAAVPGARLDVRELDLSVLDSVRAFAAGLLEEMPTLGLLINNAGIMQTPARRIADGYELQLATNHLGHFVLTGLQLPSLVGDEQPRVVTVSSFEHKTGHVDFDDLQLEQGCAPRKGPAVQARQHPLRPRARPAATRSRLIGPERPRAPWLFGHQPAVNRSHRPGGLRLADRQRPHRPRRRTRGPPAAVRRDRARRPGRPVLRSLRLPGDARWAHRGPRHRRGS